jgi:hypothetical protein
MKVGLRLIIDRFGPNTGLEIAGREIADREIADREIADLEIKVDISRGPIRRKDPHGIETNGHE